MQDEQAATPVLPSDWLRRAFHDPGAVLLHSADSAKKNQRSLLFTKPASVVHTSNSAELSSCMQQIEEALACGSYVAGYLTYEAGALLQGLSAHPLPKGAPLLCFGIYDSVEFHDPAEASSGDATNNAGTKSLDLAILPAIPYERYARQVAALQRWIAAGDTYQVNYTIPFRSETAESPERIYQALVTAQAASYSAVIRFADYFGSAPTILSFSPELFFQTDTERNILTRPMKGTAPRRENAAADLAEAHRLAVDDKNRAEHVMIVDLLRNDLGRVCEIGSVQTENLFQVETYPTLHQMTTEVRGRLRNETLWLDVFRALFPSGSITGAPKRRAMQIIHQVEDEAREVYTGAIGYIAPDGSSRFSVAIRTLQLRPSSDRSSVCLGLGGGIVADSTAPSEYAECLLKSAFVQRASKPLHLIETVRADGAVIRFEEHHLDRVTRTALELGIPNDREAIRQTLHDYLLAHPSNEPQRLRLTIELSGELNITSGPIPHWPATLQVRFAKSRTVLGDPALRHKTNFRPSYDEELKAAKQAGFAESLYTNDAGLLTEGCITNIFLLREKRLVTPYLECGVLPGILRTVVLEKGLVDESVLPIGELHTCDALLLGSSLRGFYPVQSIEFGPDQVMRFDTGRASSLVRELHQALPPMPKPRPSP